MFFDSFREIMKVGKPSEVKPGLMGQYPMLRYKCRKSGQIHFARSSKNPGKGKTTPGAISGYFLRLA